MIVVTTYSYYTILQTVILYHEKQTNRSMDLLKIILAIILPPVGVFMEVGLKGAFWLNILLTLLGYLPGIIHAVWIIAKK